MPQPVPGPSGPSGPSWESSCSGEPGTFLASPKRAESMVTRSGAHIFVGRRTERQEILKVPMGTFLVKSPPRSNTFPCGGAAGCSTNGLRARRTCISPCSASCCACSRNSATATSMLLPAAAVASQPASASASSAPPSPSTLRHRPVRHAAAGDDGRGPQLRDLEKHLHGSAGLVDARMSNPLGSCGKTNWLTPPGSPQRAAEPGAPQPAGTAAPGPAG